MDCYGDDHRVAGAANAHVINEEVLVWYFTLHELCDTGTQICIRELDVHGDVNAALRRGKTEHGQRPAFGRRLCTKRGVRPCCDDYCRRDRIPATQWAREENSVRRE